MRHISKLLNRYIALVSCKRNGAVSYMGWYRISDRFRNCPAHYYSARSFLRLAYAILCKWPDWYNMGIVLFFLVQEFAGRNAKHITQRSAFDRNRMPV